MADVTGVNLGDNLTGRHFTTFVQVTDPVTGVGRDDFYNTDVSGFFEDSWKARKGMTLNLGIRYEVQMIPQPEQPNLSTPLTKLYTSTINIDKNNFRAAHRRCLGDRQGHGPACRLRHLLREDHE